MLRLALAIALIGLPLLELMLLIRAGQMMGFWVTFGLVVGAGLLGAVVLSRQSWSVLQRTQQALAQGRPPVAPVIDGLFLVLAGALLITPGFLSDALALLLLIPPARRSIARWGLRRLVQHADVRLATFSTGIERPPTGRRGQATVIEGEFERLGERATEPHPPGPGDRV